MNEHEHGEDCQHDHDNEHVRGLPVHWVVLGISFFLVVLAAMFLIGMALGRGAKLAEQAPVAINDDTTEAVTGDLLVTWLPVEQQSVYTFNPIFRAWIDDQVTDGNGKSIISDYQAKQLGYATLDGVEYNLMAESIGVPGMGEEHSTYYLLEENPSTAAFISKPVLLLKYMAYEPSFGATGGLVNVSFAVTADSGLLTSEAVVPALEYPATMGDEPKVTVSSDVGDLTFMGPGIMLDSETKAVFSAYTIVGQLNQPNDHRQLRLFAAHTSSKDSVSASGALNELFAFSEDGRLVWYHLNIPFYTPASEKIPAYTAVTWNDGTTAMEQYTPQLTGGCGYLSMTNVVGDTGPLVAAGFATNDRSIVIYEPADFGDDALVDDFMNWKSQNANGTIEEFASGHPYFYFEDALGRYVRLTRADVIPPGECGKPVIYLYPTETTDLTVQLSPVGGFSKTEPPYGEGWNVTANPDGSLVNKADGLTYPYLFWEGRGGYYAEPKYYDVVAKADVDQYLLTTLAKFGFNAKETADFKEFWLPRMQSAAYYKIGWHGTSVMNALAPLNLSLAPQTLIRILMDYTALAAPLASNPLPEMKTPERQGFTVVEWGGVLR